MRCDIFKMKYLTLVATIFFHLTGSKFVQKKSVYNTKLTNKTITFIRISINFLEHNLQNEYYYSGDWSCL